MVIHDLDLGVLSWIGNPHTSTLWIFIIRSARGCGLFPNHSAKCDLATTSSNTMVRMGNCTQNALNLASHLLPTGNLDYQISIFGSFNQLIPKFNLIPMCLISPSTFDAFDQGQVTDWAVGDRNSLFLGEIRGVNRPRTCQTPQGHLSLMISWYVELYS